jgi:hypothetical protein
MSGKRFTEDWFDFDIPLDKQVNMFEREGWWIKGNPGDIIECIECGVNKNQIYFHANSKTDVFNRKILLRTCKVCKNKQRTVVKKLIKINPKNTDNCDCCGKYSKNLECDHNHKTHKFRGWLCNNCNTGMGRFRDDIENLEKAIEYLKRTNEI